MRGLADAERLRRFLRELAQAAETDVAVYLTGGATAVLLGWRDATIDADILIVPEHDSLFRALPRLKEELRLNVELRDLFEAIQPHLHRYPAVDPPSFRRRLDEALLPAS